eukprot:GCRY01003227.1.p1 GENE.GCRY01003227.1~~GCRY01003227.1.p1  ORF type:complete len:361 (+),score=109.71 GCRY01003227.1:272-1354(+)
MSENDPFETKKLAGTLTEDALKAAFPKQTLIRVKRKRSEEPVDSFVVRKKRSTGELGKDHKLFYRVDTLHSRSAVEGKKGAIKTSIESLQHPLTTPPPSQKRRRLAEVKETDDAPRKALRPAAAAATAEPNEGLELDYNLVDLEVLQEDHEHPPVPPALPSSHTRADDEGSEFERLMCNYVPLIREYIPEGYQTPEILQEENGGDFEYDIYVAYQSKNPYDPNELLNVCVENEGLIFEGRKALELTEAFLHDDDQDSNAEDYYLNDYPDEEPSGDELSSDDQMFDTFGNRMGYHDDFVDYAYESGEESEGELVVADEEALHRAWLAYARTHHPQRVGSGREEERAEEEAEGKDWVFGRRQ